MIHCNICELDFMRQDYESHEEKCKYSLNVLKFVQKYKNLREFSKEEWINAVRTLNSPPPPPLDIYFKQLQKETPEVRKKVAEYFLSEEFEKKYRK